MTTQASIRFLPISLMLVGLMLAGCQDSGDDGEQAGSSPDTPEDVQQSAQTDSALEQLGDAYAEITERTQACLQGSGEDCFQVGRLMENAESESGQAGPPGRIRYFYDAGCEQGHQPACDALARLED